MAHDFMPVAAAAQHCPELMARGPRPEEIAASVAAWRRDLSQQLAGRLSGLLWGDRLSVEVGVPEPLDGAAVLERIGAVAANCLLRCGAEAEAQVLFSLDHATALALAERSFGGEGRVGAPSHDPLPRSAQLLCDEIAAQIAAALAAVRCGDRAEAGASQGEVMVRSESAARLRAFASAEACVVIALRLVNLQGCEWSALLALPARRLEHLLPAAGEAAPCARAGAATGGAASESVFGAIPLPLRAVLAEWDMTLSQLDRLAPGDTLPLSVPRQVPLKLGEVVVAHGSIGTLEDHLALRLTAGPARGCVQ